MMASPRIWFRESIRLAPLAELVSELDSFNDELISVSQWKSFNLQDFAYLKYPTPNQPRSKDGPKRQLRSYRPQ